MPRCGRCQLPVLATATAVNGTTTSTVTIVQNEPNGGTELQSFNIGKSTTLSFDQSAGGADVGQWIAFNKIASPVSVANLGQINAAGQV